MLDGWTASNRVSKPLPDEGAFVNTLPVATIGSNQGSIPAPERRIPFGKPACAAEIAFRIAWRAKACSIARSSLETGKLEG